MTIHDKAQIAKVRDNLKESLYHVRNEVTEVIIRKQIKTLNELIGK